MGDLAKALYYISGMTLIKVLGRKEAEKERIGWMSIKGDRFLWLWIMFSLMGVESDFPICVMKTIINVLAKLIGFYIYVSWWLYWPAHESQLAYVFSGRKSIPLCNIYHNRICVMIEYFLWIVHEMN